LDRPARLLLDDKGALANAATGYQLAGTDLHEVATSQLSVDRQVKEGAIPQSMFLL
jgi:hypothetical protein